MLGRTANGIYWMMRYVERSENVARLVEAGLRMSLTRSSSAASEWASVLETAGAKWAFVERHGENFEASTVVDFLLRDKTFPSSVQSMFEAARTNARMVRTAITREVWEATNESWLSLSSRLARPVREGDVPAVLELIRRQSALIRGALHGTMLRNEIYNFARIGTFIERADNTARILDVKYYVLLPSLQHVGSSLDNVQWESILRSVSAHGSYRFIHGPNYAPDRIAGLLIFEMRLPRSLLFSQSKINENLMHLAREYGSENSAIAESSALLGRMRGQTMEQIMQTGLHDFLQDFIRDNNNIGLAIDREYRFYE